MTDELKPVLDALISAAGRRDPEAFQQAIADLRALKVCSHVLDVDGKTSIGEMIAQTMAGQAAELSVWRTCAAVFRLSPADWKKFSQACIVGEKFPEALVALENIRDEVEFRRDYLRISGRAWAGMADWPRALFFFETGVRDFGDTEVSPGFLLDRANAHWQLGMLEEAAADFTVIKSRWPNNMQGYEGLVRTFCANRAFAAASCVADEAEKKLPNIADIRAIQAAIVSDAGGQAEVKAFLRLLVLESIDPAGKARIVDRALRNSTNFSAALWAELLEMFSGQPECLSAVGKYHNRSLQLIGARLAPAASNQMRVEQKLAGRTARVGELLRAGQIGPAMDIAADVEAEIANWPSAPDHVINVVLWRMVRTGRVASAKELYWRQRSKRRKPDRLCELVQLQEGRGDPAVTVFCQARNEAVNLQSFLDHHRNIGVNEFCIVDNGSNDHTLGILEGCDDVTLYQTASSYRRAVAGADWFNSLSRLPRYAGALCLRLDADERFIFPHCDRVSVSKLRDYMLSRHFDAIQGVMVDLFPRTYDEIQESGDHILPSRFFDPGVEAQESLVAPYVEYYSTPRLRSVDGLRPQVSKVPGTMADGFIERIGSHRCSPVQLADISCALLHYKFRPDFKQRALEEIRRKEYAQNGQYWTQFPDFEAGASVMVDEKSVEFDGWRSLMEAGLLKTSDTWDRFVGETA